MHDPHAPQPPHRLTLATVSLRIGAAFYVLVAIGVPLFLVLVDVPEPADTVELWIRNGTIAFVIVLSLGMAALSEVIVWGLHRRRMWAWIAGLCVFGLYLPSLFFPLGALGLWGLLDPGSRALFGMGQAGLASPPGAAGGAAVKSGRGPGCAIAAICLVALVVLGLPVVGIVAAIAIPNFFDAKSRAQRVSTIADLRAISAAVEASRLATGALPSEGPIETVLAELRAHAAGDLPAVDAWGHPLRYSCWSDFGLPDCTNYAVLSPGRDGVFEHDHPRKYFEEPEPSLVGTARYDADLLVVDGVVVRDP